MVRGRGMNVAGVGLGGEGGRVDSRGEGGGRGKVMQFPFNKLYTLYKLLTFNF